MAGWLGPQGWNPILQPFSLRPSLSQLALLAVYFFKLTELARE